MVASWQQNAQVTFREHGEPASYKALEKVLQKIYCSAFIILQTHGTVTKHYSSFFPSTTPDGWLTSDGLTGYPTNSHSPDGDSP